MPIAQSSPARSADRRSPAAALVIMVGLAAMLAAVPGCSRGTSGGGAGGNAAAGGGDGPQATAAGGSGAAGGNTAPSGGPGAAAGSALGSASAGGSAGTAGGSVAGAVTDLERLLAFTVRTFEGDDDDAFGESITNARKRIAELKQLLPGARLDAARLQTATGAVTKIAGILDAAEARLRANTEAAPAEIEAFARQTTEAMKALKSSTAGLR